MESIEPGGAGDSRRRGGVDGAADSRLDLRRELGAGAIVPTGVRRTTRLRLDGRSLPRRRDWIRRVLLVLRSRVVPVLLSARGVDAHLSPLQPISHSRGQEKMHLV